MKRKILDVLFHDPDGDGADYAKLWKHRFYNLPLEYAGNISGGWVRYKWGVMEVCQNARNGRLEIMCNGMRWHSC